MTTIAAGPSTTPIPTVVTGVVHSVTASFAGSGWTLRFGPSGPSAVVRRLAEAGPTARALVAAGLDLPVGALHDAALRVRIEPDRASVTALRRDGTRHRRTGPAGWIAGRLPGWIAGWPGWHRGALRV